MSEGKAVIEDSKPAVIEKVFETEGLDPKEITSAKKFGLVKDDKKEEIPSKKGEEEKGKEGESKEKPLDPASFEEMDEAYNKDQANFHKGFTPNAKALYFKFKRNRQLRQDAETAKEEIEKDRDFLATQEKAYLKKMAEVNDILDRIDGGDDKITTADIRKVIAFKKEEAKRESQEGDNKKEEKKPTAEEEEKHTKYLQEKAKNAELLGKAKYEDFDRYVKLANEVVAKDKDVAVLITRAYHDPEVDEEQLMEKIVKYAKLHPDFDKKVEKEEEEDEGEEKKPKKVEKKDSKEIDRMVANSQKKKTSAAISGGSGRREVGYDDLTVEDVAAMSRAEYSKLPKEVRQRILRESV